MHLKRDNVCAGVAVLGVICTANGRRNGGPRLMPLWADGFWAAPASDAPAGSRLGPICHPSMKVIVTGKTRVTGIKAVGTAPRPSR